MSVDYEAERDRWRVRWREDGRQRTRRFRSYEEAVAFDDEMSEPSPAPVAETQALQSSGGDGIYPYSTGRGVRWRFVFRQSDGTMSSRRGFTTRRAAARARERLNESIRRGKVKVARQTFADFWESALAQKRRYVTAGS